jgi:hypothetical protein
MKPKKNRQNMTPVPSIAPSRIGPQVPEPTFQEKTLIQRLEDFMALKSQKEKALPIPAPMKRQQALEYLAKKFNVPVEQVAESIPEAKTFIVPTRGGTIPEHSGMAPEGMGYAGAYENIPSMRGRNNPYPENRIRIGSGFESEPFVRNEELFHSTQYDGPNIARGIGYNRNIRAIKKGLRNLDQIDLKNPNAMWDYFFDPYETEAKIMTNKTILRELGVIGSGDVTDEDLDNIYLWANEMYNSGDKTNQIRANDMLRLVGFPGDNRINDPEYRKQLVKLFNRL